MHRISKTFALLFVATFLICMVSVHPATVKAQSKTIIVPDDYPTIQQAVDNSANCDTIFLRSGTYEGEINKTLVIDKSISLTGENSTVINLHPKYSVGRILYLSFFHSCDDAMQINATGVTISNLTINSVSDIRVSNERAQFVNTKLNSGSSDSGLIINSLGCNVTKSSIGRLQIINGSLNSIIGNNIKYLEIESCSKNLIEYNQIKHLYLNRSDNNVVSDNDISTELDDPVIWVGNSSNNILSYNNVTARLYNTNLKILYSSCQNSIYGNNFLFPKKNDSDIKKFSDDYYAKNASRIVKVDISAHNNFWEQSERGNYWQGYDGADVNFDGIGDTPYIIDAKNVDPYPLMKPTYEKLVVESSNNYILISVILLTIAIVISVSILLLRRHRKTAQVSS
jgi:nitrous oxidase accessory protein NosD